MTRHMFGAIQIVVDQAVIEIGAGEALLEKIEERVQSRRRSRDVSPAFLVLPKAEERKLTISIL